RRRPAPPRRPTSTLPSPPARQDLAETRIPFGVRGELPALYRAVGCSYCSKTGYRGRVALHEVMLMSEEIERLTVERRSSDDISRVAVEQGMVQLRGDGIAKVFAGITSIEEIQRVVV